MKPLIALALLIPLLTAWAAERHVATLNDPVGDDDGNGALVYPQRAEYERGDLDLVSLRIFRGDDSYRFEATFRNPIRDPASVTNDAGGEPLSYFVRRGFYSFNLDIYIDQDRRPGSGNTFTLPGRRVPIDLAHAWEKAVILTPRPELMRQQLIDTVAETEAARNIEAVAARIDAAIYFPTQIRVRGRSLSFVVPASFLSAQRADSEWSAVAFVTGAKTAIEANLNLFRAPGSPLERLELGVLQPAQGRPRETFGYSSRESPSPIVDLLAPDRQRERLSAAGGLSGVTWGAQPAVTGGAPAQPATSLIAAPVPVPAPTAPAASAPPPVPAPPTVAVPATPAPPATTAAPAAPAPTAPAASPMPRSESPPAARKSVEPTAAARPSIADRLKTLKDLFDQKLIDETEYKQQRQRILNEL